MISLKQRTIRRILNRGGADKGWEEVEEGTYERTTQWKVFGVERPAIVPGVDNRPEIILAFDPGETTGWCYVGRSNTMPTFEPEVRHGDLDTKESSEPIIDLLEHERPDIVITERFDNRGNPAANLRPVEIIGVLKSWCRVNYPDLVQQAQLKGDKDHTALWSDNKLRLLGQYTPGHSDENDAVRQALYYVTVTLNDMWFVNQLKGDLHDG